MNAERQAEISFSHDTSGQFIVNLMTTEHRRWFVEFEKENYGGTPRRLLFATDPFGNLKGVLYYKYDGFTLRSYCTFVSESVRGQGLGTQLWVLALELERPRKVVVTTVSDRGFTMMKALEERFPRIAWDLADGGLRKPRDMRKGKKRR